MAGDWIKMRSNLWDDPRVAKVCDLTSKTEAAVIGGLYWLWAMADQHSVDGHLPGLTVRQLDRKTGIDNFGTALLAVGWLSADGDELYIPHFDEHNGSSAKKRAQTARRVAVCKASGNVDSEPKDTVNEQQVTQQHTTGNAPSVIGALPREREREEEGCKHPPAQATACAEALAAAAVDKAAALPPCPAEQLVGLYHELLPELPRCRTMLDARAKALRRRWRWVLCSRKADGQRRAVDAEAALGWFRAFFERVRHSDWLMGRTPRGPGHQGWQCDLDFLLSDKGVKAVVESTELRAEVAA